MTVYEKVVGGVVVERVQPIDGDHTDTLLGCMILDGNPNWRIAVEGQADNEPEPDIAAPAVLVAAEERAPAEPKPTPPKPAGKRATPKE